MLRTSAPLIGALGIKSKAEIMTNREVHYRYAIGHLCEIIVLILALAYYNVPDLVDKFSFALTISSLLLAILAIFFTIIASQKQDLQLTKIIETNAAMASAADEIRTSARDITIFAKDAPEKLQSIDNKIDQIAFNYASVSPAVAAQETPNEPEPINISISALQFRQMFKHLHFGAMQALYLFERSFSKDKSIPKHLFNDLAFCSWDYAVGFLNALESVGMLSFKIYKEELIPISCSDVITSGIAQNLNAVATVVEKQRGEAILRKMEAIDAFAA